jgi:hypothetical protein
VCVAGDGGAGMKTPDANFQWRIDQWQVDMIAV